MNSREILTGIMNQNASQDVIVAFSGGVDSSLILKLAVTAAREKGTKVYAVTFQTRLHPMGELDHTARVAKEAGAEHMIIESDELSYAGIANNPEDRCYRCKKYLFSQLLQLAGELGTTIIYEGSNEDDMNVYRPGFKAVKELGVISPLASAGMTKKEIRAMAAELGLSVADRPSAPCLATRFPYGTPIDYGLLAKADEAEQYIRSLGGQNIRLRIHGDIVRLEVDVEDFSIVLNNREEIIQKLKAAGFIYITLDLEGFRSGSMDYKIDKGRWDSES